MTASPIHSRRVARGGMEAASIMMRTGPYGGGSALQPVAGTEDPVHDTEAEQEEAKRGGETHADGDVRRPVETPAEAADQVHHRIEQAERAPERRQHVDRVEGAAQERERRDDQHGNELKPLESVG